MKFISSEQLTSFLLTDNENYEICYNFHLALVARKLTLKFIV